MARGNDLRVLLLAAMILLAQTICGLTDDRSGQAAAMPQHAPHINAQRWG